MKPMEYTPAGRRAEVHGKPTITFIKDGHRCFIFEHEYEAWVKEHKKRLNWEMCAAEYWRAENHYLVFGEGLTESESGKRLNTWHRFATTDHAFES